jgi:hypothetical protein
VSGGLVSIAARVRSGVEGLGRRDDVTAQLRRIDAVDRAADSLRRDVDDLKEMLAVTRAAEFAPAMPDPAEVTVAVDSLRDQLERGDVDREFAQEVINSVERLVRVASESLVVAWHGHVADRIPSQEGLLILADAFSDVEGAGTYATRLRAAARSVQSFLQRAPTDDAVSELDRLASEIPQLLQQLVGDQPDVQAFAEQLARGGAAIEALTPPVLQWMQEKGFAGSFKIVPGRPGHDSTRRA